MFKDHLFLALGWLLYCLLHSLLANEKNKARLVSYLRIQQLTYRLAYNIFALITLVILLLYHRSVPGRFLFDRQPVLIFSILFIMIGVVIMAVCIRKYFMQLSGLQKDKTAAVPFLETGGIHGIVRHPLYLGTFIFLVGGFLLFPLLSNLIAVVIIIIYTLLGIKLEERKLVQQFGEAYRNYQKKVPGIIPFLK